MSLKKISFAGVLLLTIFFNSCTKENSSSSPLLTTTVNDRTTPLELAATAGTLHNAGLEHLRLNFDFSRSFASTSVLADSVLYSLCNYFQTTQGLNYSTGYQAFARDSVKAEYAIDMFGTNSKVLNYLSRIRNTSVLTTNLSTDELKFIDSLSLFFMTNVSGMSKSQICTLAYNKSVSLLSNFNAMSWSTGQGTLASGALNTLKGTSSYWANRDRTGFIGFAESGGVTGNEAWVILQADCVGYIYGWVGALIDDANSPGGVQSSGQNRRIQQGFNGASSASAFAVLF